MLHKRKYHRLIFLPVTWKMTITQEGPHKPFLYPRPTIARANARARSARARGAKRETFLICFAK